MNEVVHEAFQAELEKISGVMATDVAAGLLALTGAGMVSYDLWNAREFPGAYRRFKKGMKDPSDQVDLKKYLRGRDPRVTAVTTPAGVDALVKKEGTNPIDRFLSGLMLKHGLRKKNNAFAMRGRHGEYVIASPRVPQAVVDHELGHIHDFRAKKIRPGRDNPYARWGPAGSVARALHKPYFKQTTVQAEREAWKRAPASKSKRMLEPEAMKVYDTGFHVNRATIVGGLAVGGAGTYFAGRASAPLVRRAFRALLQRK